MAGPVVYDNTFIFHKSGGHPISFEASNQDLTDSTFQYFGYISSTGSWIIQRFHIIASTIIYEYAAGRSRKNYDVHWNTTTGRFVEAPTLTFDTFDVIGDNL